MTPSPTTFDTVTLVRGALLCSNLLRFRLYRLHALVENVGEVAVNSGCEDPETIQSGLVAAA
jgi:hypothetical protein